MKYSPDEHDGRPAAPESELLVKRINDQFDECCAVGGHWDRMRDIALEAVATLLGELDFTHQRAEQAEKRCDLAQTEIKGHMRVEDDLQARIAELEKYDERYTWLVGRLFERSLHFQGIGSAIQLCAANGDVLGSGAGADAAIDAALKSRA